MYIFILVAAFVVTLVTLAALLFAAFWRRKIVFDQMEDEYSDDGSCTSTGPSAGYVEGYAYASPKQIWVGDGWVQVSGTQSQQDVLKLLEGISDLEDARSKGDKVNILGCFLDICQELILAWSEADALAVMRALQAYLEAQDMALACQYVACHPLEAAQESASQVALEGDVDGRPLASPAPAICQEVIYPPKATKKAKKKPVKKAPKKAPRRR